MRYVVTILASIFLAVFVAAGVSFVHPSVSKAASGGGYVKTCTGGSMYLNAYEKRTFALHNQIRRDYNLRTFCLHPRLVRAAREHSQDMIKRDYFSHYTKGSGLDPGQRLDRVGYNWRIYAENIAYGSGAHGEPDSIMNAWMNSDGHRRNILNGKLREIGIGEVTGEFSGYKNVSMYTVDFGTR